VQRRNLKDEECFDREIWRTKIMSLGWGKLCIHRKIPKIITCNVVEQSPFPSLLLPSSGKSQVGSVSQRESQLSLKRGQLYVCQVKPSRRVVTSTWWEGLVLPMIPRAMPAGA
jgi:hypothetical protein